MRLHQIIDQEHLLSRAYKPMSAQPRPFVRWAGSKRALMRQIVPFLPSGFNRYFEPFLGSGALFFLIEPRNAFLNDSCTELAFTFQSVKKNSSAVARWATHQPLTKENFYEIRANRSQEPARRAGEFLYLNRGCWNGLYRVNASGEFNVPWGAPKSGFIVDAANLAACAETLNNAEAIVTSEDFEIALKGCKAGDLVFLDPPYVTMHNNNGFVDYNERLFSWRDQVRLAQVAATLRNKGCTVLVTNAYHEEILRLYADFDPKPLMRHSTLAGSAAARVPIKEVLLVG